MQNILEGDIFTAIKYFVEGGVCMDAHTKKVIAPVVITVLLVLYLVLYLAIGISSPIPMAYKIVGLLIPLGLIGVSIYVLIERIKEIRSGEEDDISQY